MTLQEFNKKYKLEETQTEVTVTYFNSYLSAENLNEEYNIPDFNDSHNDYDNSTTVYTLFTNDFAPVACFNSWEKMRKYIETMVTNI